MKFFLFFFIIVSLSNSFSNIQLRKISEIKVGNFTLAYFLKVHNDGLKQIDITKNMNNSELIKNELSTYLEKNNLNINYLKEADLSNANLKDLDFRFLNLKESKLINSDFEGTNLKESDITNANLSSTNLMGANLKEATVKNANFSNSNLAGADIHEAVGLSLKQLLTCNSLYKTKLSEDLLKLIEKEMPELIK